ncbi:hypothetical protein COW36_03440 [bacterium (Candidatus Blackallbacteria) CG17_big_fil_post_rev_8_21_14_2_50_48_46]|uniref:Uncharacterized protein n=1 Tax=bacterium (Candidatus Blackallbacteria) CG17_big_fil_post_rev_8_21_14_2_50_48_46 TaxID=2014261 RepID=A0A2M7G9H4_9BACT|nr:MAG: hypothetical protein COW64_25860 [bacterium (Candidatus Blackallbacteria) CG18_big_fil_WC_8_21_14_2_50_49_26]PIW18764.1 MAG: hypothetical protein COW36_03440 [bacterium (Candidatus Blackallbacteria) CG17_big_fil_post_rev_8_21_14_2_50_48_46]PIW49451.1 MAG: hypothetical protein COW20_05805 [bacterium (Candidatus Blackallbacteria) CG13_big_fil_rev_8_21_14_2_50_49_14]
MKTRKSQHILFTIALIGFFSFQSLLPAFALVEPVKKVVDKKNAVDNTAEDDAIKAFNEQQDAITNSQSRLGDELKSLPGPNINFAELLRWVITVSASLAGSVGLYLLVMAGFKSISGTEESHNELKQVLVRVLVGLTVIFFSYKIIEFIMGIIWAGN